MAKLKVKMNELISGHNVAYDEQKALLEEIRKDLSCIQQREEFYHPQISKLSIENMELRQEIDSLKLRLLDMATKTEAVEKSMHIMMGMFLTANRANPVNPTSLVELYNFCVNCLRCRQLESLEHIGGHRPGRVGSGRTGHGRIGGLV